MLWQSQRQAPGDSPDLRAIAGLTGHLEVASGPDGEALSHLPCTVGRVTRSEILVTLLRPESIPLPGSAAILEVISLKALIQCFTTVQWTAADGKVALATPARPHVVQRRRFPRVELFLGVTLRPEDRPVEPLPAQMINLSVDGAACVMVEPLTPGSAATLDLTPVGLHPPEVTARVIRCRPSPSHLWLVGLQFEALRPEQEFYLGKYLGDYAEETRE